MEITRASLINHIWLKIQQERRKGYDTYLYTEEDQRQNKLWNMYPWYRIDASGDIFPSQWLPRIIGDCPPPIERLGTILPGESIVRRVPQQTSHETNHKKAKVYDLRISEKIFFVPDHLNSRLSFFRWDLEDPVVPRDTSFREYLDHQLHSRVIT
jgi:hypothetical protein